VTLKHLFLSRSVTCNALGATAMDGHASLPWRERLRDDYRTRFMCLNEFGCCIGHRNIPKPELRAPKFIDLMIDGLTKVNPLFTVTSYLGVDHGEHRRTGATASCDSTGSSDSSDQRTQPLLITGNKTRDATLGESRIRAGEIVGWRFWKLYNGFLFSVFASYVWRPGVFE
jgi:hypothetical protein